MGDGLRDGWYAFGTKPGGVGCMLGDAENFLCRKLRHR